MTRISDLTVQAINSALRKIGMEICCIKDRVTILEEQVAEDFDEILLSDGPLSGEAPEGAKVGLDTENNTFYYVDINGEWQVLELGTPLNVEALALVDDISTFGDPDIDALVIEDLDRGGTFYKYTGAQVEDGGVIFEDSLGQKWKRDLSQTDYIDLKWYGIVERATFNLVDDIYPAITAAMTAAYDNENLKAAKVRIPRTSASNLFYCCGSTIEITEAITLFGDGQQSTIRFTQDMTGIWTHYTGSNFQTVLKDFRVQGQGIATTGMGVLINNPVYTENFEAWSFYDGIHFIGNAGGGTNCNNSTNIRLRVVNNRRHGVYINGADANQISFWHLDAISNGGMGVSDQCFLGNMYYNSHFATNSSPTLTYQKGMVRYGGVIYVSIRDNNIAIEPTVTANWAEYWYTDSAMQVWTPTYDANIPVWSALSTYHSSGCYNLNGDSTPPIGSGENQWGLMMGTYIEGDQPSGYIGNRCQSIGGNPNNRGFNATQDANLGMFQTIKGAYLAGPNDAADINTYIGGSDSNFGQGLQIFRSSTDGFFLRYYNGAAFDENMARVGSQRGSATGRVYFTNNSTTATNLGRTNLTNFNDGNAGFYRFLLRNNATNHFAGIEQNNLRSSLPTITTRDRGDKVFFQKSSFSSEKIESIYAVKDDPIAGWSGYANNANDEWITIKGFAEKVLTNVSGTVNLFVDFNIASGKSILLDVTFVANNGTDDCVIQRRVLVRNTAGTLSLKNNQEIGTSLKEGVYSTADIDFSLATDDLTTRLINLPASTSGKVNIKRIDI